MGSNAVPSGAISRIVGYLLGAGNFSTVSPNLPQSVAIFAEANDTNQATMPTAGTVITSAAQAGLLYGFGSPIYLIARILFPVNGGGLTSIPVTVFANPKAGGSTPCKIEIVPSGVATADVTHTLCIAGRQGLDAQFYNLNINQGDSTSEIAAYIEDAINGILGSPVSCASTDYEATATTKWSGLTADELTISVNTNNNAAGITYGITKIQAGSGTPAIADALAQFGSTWYTILGNGYSTQAGIMAALDAFNGYPDPTNPTGRYTGIIMQPFMAVTGSTADDPSSITDADPNNLTIAIAPAPGSKAFTFEAMANMIALFATQSQNAPQLDIAGQSYPDMPGPSTWTSANAMASYNNRDAIVKKGCSTVTVQAGVYVVQDFVTTYHPAGQSAPVFRYCRDNMIFWNIRFGYYLLEQQFVINHIIVADTDTVNAPNLVKPKSWKSVLFNYAVTLNQSGFITEPEFMQKSIQVTLNASNPNRLDTTFNAKISGIARISATTAVMGFNFGTTN